ncbi:MAG TPA: hypothetical protein VN154_11095 [Rhizomicrobium sp.]|nr:hypothetical protein [Rhizomicrobium sp.]
MRVLVLHTAMTGEPRLDDLDTLTTAQAIAKTLQHCGHSAVLAPFEFSAEAVLAQMKDAHADIVFNMVESVLGQDHLSSVAPAIFEHLAIPFTGSGGVAIAATSDKPFAKTMMRACGFATPDWSEPPHWRMLSDGKRYIVKSATEDASLALDDESVCGTIASVRARAKLCAAHYGGRWFAEAFVDGREFNVALVEAREGWQALPVAEMRFQDWPNGKPKIVGYGAKWNEQSEESTKTIRRFGHEKHEPSVASALIAAAINVCRLFGLRGYARVDFRLDAAGVPQILEVNSNPCLAPEAGFAAAARQNGWSYADTILHVLNGARLR